MKVERLRFVVAQAALVLALGSTAARAAEDHHPPVALSKTYTVTLGQMIAGSASTILQTLKPIDAPMMAMYTGQRIEIWVLGARSTADGAQETLDRFQEKAWPTLVAMIQGLYGVKLSDQQVSVIYRNRDADNREVIRRENGKYYVKGD